MSGRPTIDTLPALPRDDGGPVFREPWEAQAFALAVELHARGLFTWREWAETLGGEIARARARGDPDTGETYYSHWLSALEHLVIVKGAMSRGELDARTAAWDRAARATPHGEPIVLGRDLSEGAQR